MLVDLHLPPVAVPRLAVSSYWLRYILVSSPSQNHQINALASTYMRLAEAAAIEYGLAAAALRKVWSDQTSFGINEMHRAITHFETCLTNMYRAINAYRRLRKHKDKDPLTTFLNRPKPTFVSDTVAQRVRNMRDAIHHLDDKVLNGEVTEGQPIAIKPDGPVVAHPSELGQTIKTIDRLVIGPHELSFTEIAALLEEMACAAEKISEFGSDAGNHQT